MGSDRTSLAAEQSRRLKPTLRRFDIVFLIVAAVVSIEALGQVSTFGAETFTWALVLAGTFLFPYGLIFAEVGSTFTQQGGSYVWVRMAFGRFVAALSAIFYWVTQPVWVGGSMAFLAVQTWGHFLAPIETGSATDYVVKLAFIWCTVLAAIISLRYGKWLPTAGAIIKVAFLAFFCVTAVIYAVQHGVQGIGSASFTPTAAGFLGLTPLLLFAYLGFEGGNSAAEEMRNPRRDVPASLARSGGIAVGCYLLPIFAILAVLPAGKITGIGGLMDAVKVVFGVYGPAAPVMLDIAAVAFMFVLASQGSAWMIISDRIQAIAAADGAFFGGYLGVFHRHLGTPVRMNLTSGIVATLFMLAAMTFVTGTSAAIFSVVLTIAISTFLIAYLAFIPAAVRLRTRFPELHRPYRVPAGNTAFTMLGGLSLAWVALGTWVAIFPGTLENLVGLSYDFGGEWGVSRATFETFTLGTLAALAVLAIVGYWRGRSVRQRQDTGETTQGTELSGKSDS